LTVTLLVEKYEDEKYPIDIPDPISAIKFRMDQEVHISVQTCHIVNLILVSVRWQSSTGIGGRFHRNTHLRFILHFTGFYTIDLLKKIN